MYVAITLTVAGAALLRYLLPLIRKQGVRTRDGDLPLWNEIESSSQAAEACSQRSSLKQREQSAPNEQPPRLSRQPSHSCSPLSSGDSSRMGLTGKRDCRRCR